MDLLFVPSQKQLRELEAQSSKRRSELEAETQALTTKVTQVSKDRSKG